MKTSPLMRFVAAVASFTMFVVVTVGGLCAAEIAAEIFCYRRELKMHGDESVVVCGDSRTERGLNPGVWSELFNFSLSGRPIDQSYLTMLDILAANPGKTKTLLVDVSPEEVRVNCATPVGKLERGGGYLLLYLLHWRTPVRDMSGAVGLFRDIMVSERMHLLSRVIRGKRTFRSSLCSGYQATDRCLQREKPELFDRLVRQWSERMQDTLSQAEAKTGYFAMLDRMIDVARKEGVEVCLLTPPWHPRLVRQVGREKIDNFTTVVSRYAARKGCRYLNALSMSFPDSYWMDENHLNSKGAVEFTRIVRDWTRRLE